MVRPIRAPEIRVQSAIGEAIDGPFDCPRIDFGEETLSSIPRLGRSADMSCMPNTSRSYVLRNTAIGSESSYESVGEALDAVNSMVGEGDEWFVLEIDSLRVVLPRSDRRRVRGTEPVADGCGHNSRPRAA